MKIHNLNTTESVRNQYTVLPEEHILGFYLSYEDTTALNVLLRRWQHLRVNTYQEVITRAIEQRTDIKELTLTKTGRHVNQGKVWLEKDVREKILKEASRYGLNPADYIRAIIYSVYQKTMQDTIKQREKKAKYDHDNRTLSFSIQVDPHVRGTLYKKYGKLTDKELLAAVQKDAGKWLNEGGE